MKILCHYTKELHAKTILESSKLKFGLLARSNDPIEIKKLSLWTIALTKETVRDTNRRMNSYRDNILRLLCFSTGTIKDDLLSEDNETIYMKDLESHPPFYLPRTWAQYGEDHNGVCFVVSKLKLGNKFKKFAADEYEFRLEDMKYIDFFKEHHLIEIQDFLSISKKKILKHRDKGVVHKILNDHYRDLYMVKDVDWKDEKECRALLWEKKPCAVQAEVRFNIDGLLKAIFLGLRFNPSSLSFFKIQAKARKIPLYKLRLYENIILAERLM
jgi:hypothetical protein